MVKVAGFSFKTSSLFWWPVRSAQLLVRRMVVQGQPLENPCAQQPPPSINGGPSRRAFPCNAGWVE
eukprot:5754187-Prorocentrum_lima.AAC.1